MHLIKSCLIAFSMYSRIPMPRTEWQEEDMRYVMCFFPLIGLAIGLLLCGWVWLAGRLQIGAALFSGVATALPVLITGESIWMAFATRWTPWVPGSHRRESSKF